MPYSLKGDCVVKTDTGESVPGGCHKNHEDAVNHLRALEANVKSSGIVEMSLRITKASYNKSEDSPRKWTAIDSDIDEDLYQEKMSIELYKDFISRIENKTPVPEQFRDVICENGWCGEMPYLSVAHYKAGTDNRNVPGTVDSVFLDGTRLKSKGTLSDTPMGRKVFDALVDDLYKKKSDPQHLPVRISIGFLDLEHKHLSEVGGQEFTFTRTDVGQLCPLCVQGIGGKIYTKGQLVHLAMTRVPANPRTEMSVERSMDEITTKKQDAESILGDLANELEEKSIANDVLVVRSDEAGSLPTPAPNPFEGCYDPNNGGWNQECINGVMSKWMADMRAEIGTTVKSVIGEVVEDARRKDVSDAEKEHAKKEYGDVKFADEANSKYPIDTKEHAKAALSYWGMPKNRGKYSPEEQKKIGGRIRAAAKKFGIEVTEKKSDTVEDAMDENVNKVALGGTSVPEKPFKFTQDGVTVTGGVNENVIPAPVKSKADDEEDAKDNGADDEAEGEKPMKKSTALDNAFATLKSLVEKRAGVEDVNKAFAELGTAVETAYAPEPKPFDPNDLAAIVKSAVENAVQPLRIEIATLKAGQVNTVSNGQVVKSKALTLNGYARPEDLIQRAVPQPTRKLTQIEQIARKSTGLS